MKYKCNIYFNNNIRPFEITLNEQEYNDFNNFIKEDATSTSFDNVYILYKDDTEYAIFRNNINLVSFYEV